MKIFLTALVLYFISSTQTIYSQSSPVDKVQFFKDETPINAKIEAYWSKLIKQKNKPGQITPARFVTVLPGNTIIDEPAQLEVRGHFRREYCFVPPIKLIFKKSDTSKMHHLKSLKLVSTCKSSNIYQQYLLKEFLIYKMYNLLTDKSLRVRLLNIDYADSSGKKNEFAGPAFLIEDEKDMAKRNKCIDWSKGKIFTESTDRKQMTLVSIFEYMIGNTDWSVPANHNIKLIQSKEDTTSRPFAVPYDFDYAGIINTDYAVPDPLLNTETVQQRVYRGFKRTLDEINETLLIFQEQKAGIYNLINNFEQLTPGSKKNMTNYLDEFYQEISKPKEVKSVFVDNARVE
jgi:hypothetical protein